MSITEQYFLDLYRARRLGEPTVPAPGAHDWQVVRELRDHWELRVAAAGGHGRTRRALSRWFHRAGHGSSG
ncbi:hypothetical protein OK074_9131 [Actinobacteria bacterium OK074]|nr:hypothetical protein OK074_9131 [Actinobacteria bacterium OK074]